MMYTELQKECLIAEYVHSSASVIVKWRYICQSACKHPHVLLEDSPKQNGGQGWKFKVYQTEMISNGAKSFQHFEILLVDKPNEHVA